ncbi:MAG: Lrp/AsnC family transcriptional regulator [Saprospiraceae bacterium]|nr:Lrp/AsnC family transcriptional regulator [Saprospiraceae bacterium]
MIDDKDKMLLTLLKKNSKMTIKELSQATHLSPTPVYERIRKMEKEGIITSYSITVDEKKLGKNLTVFCQISLDIHHKDVIKAFEEEIVLFDEVLACYHLTGIMDYMLHVVVSDMDDFQNFLKTNLPV